MVSTQKLSHCEKDGLQYLASLVYNQRQGNSALYHAANTAQLIYLDFNFKIQSMTRSLKIPPCSFQIKRGNFWNFLRFDSFEISQSMHA